MGHFAITAFILRAFGDAGLPRFSLATKFSPTARGF
jgi:hypothetical protein